jgi:hypothetical protein
MAESLDEATKEKNMLILTVAEIRDLARFAGLMIDDKTSPSNDELDSTIVIRACPPDGVKNEGEPSDPESVSHYRYIAFHDEYPDEGCIGLGDELVAPSHE